MNILTTIMKFIPGANLVAVPMAILEFLGKVLKWFWKGIEDCFTHPATFLVCAAFSIGGAYGMAKFVGHRVSELRVELRDVRGKLAAAENERDQWRTRLDEQKKRADEAEAARKKAEDEAKKAVVPAAPAPLGRVYRQAPGATSVKPFAASGSWLPRF